MKTSEYIKRHINYFSIKTRISMQTNKEYKADFYSMMAFDIFHMVTMMIFFSVIMTLTSDFLNWNLTDFFLFFMFNLLMWKILWIHNLRGFEKNLLKGELNTSILRPLNIYYQESSRHINYQNMISGFIMLLIIIYVTIVNNYSNPVSGILFFFFGCIYFMVFFNFFKSFCFFMKSNDFETIIFKTNSVVRQFTPKAFSNLSTSSIFYSMPATVSSYFAIEILKGNYNELFFYMPTITIILIAMLLSIYIMWFIGLKKYEAFG